MNTRDLNIVDYWNILSRQKYTIVVVMLLMTCTTGGLLLIFPQTLQYEAVSKVRLESLSNVQNLLTQVSQAWYADEIGSQVEIVKSFPVIEQVAKQLKLVPDTEPPELPRSESYLLTISDLQQHVQSAKEGDTTIIKITAVAKTGKAAAELANAVAQAYREYSGDLRARRVNDAWRFAEAQRAILEGNLKRAEDALREFREQKGQIFLPEEKQRRLNQMTSLEAEYEETRRQRHEALYQIRQLGQEEMWVEPDQGLGFYERIYTADSNQILFKQNLDMLELIRERETLLVDMTPQHPQVKTLNLKIRHLQLEMEGELASKIEHLHERESLLKGQLDAQRGEYRKFPEAAIQLARLEREVLVNADLYAKLRTKQLEMRMANASEVEEITVLEPAHIPQESMASLDRGMKVLISALLGIFFGVIAGFIRESVSRSLSRPKEFEEYLGVPVFGVVSTVDEKARRKGASHKGRKGESEEQMGILSQLCCLWDPQSHLAETIRAIRSNLQFACVKPEVKTILMANLDLEQDRMSSSSGSATLVNLALLFAEDGKRVLLVDANVRHPVIHERLGLAREPGLTDALIEGSDWQEKVRNSTDFMMGPLGIERVLLTPELDFFDVLTAGTISANPSKILHSARLGELIRCMREEYDYVLFDAAPILTAPDTTVLSSKLDGVVLFCQNEETSTSALERAKVLLDQARGVLLGVVLTKVRPEHFSEYPAAHFNGELVSQV